jgi:toxin ParE1/3/4
VKRQRILVRPAAAEDLDERMAYIARDSVDAALRLFSAVYDTYRLLAARPGMGIECESLNPRLVGLRRWVVKGFPNDVVYYRPVRNGVEVIRLLHGAQDRDRIIGRETP